MCIMCRISRIVINCMLLISIASAEPNVRDKRDYDFFKSLLSAFLYGDSDGAVMRLPSISSQPECRLCQIPGFSEIEPSKTADDMTILKKAKDKLESYPLEYYIGTNTPKDTDAAIENVRKLISTGIISVPDAMVHDVMWPMISRRRNVKLMKGRVMPVTVDINANNDALKKAKNIPDVPAKIQSVTKFTFRKEPEVGVSGNVVTPPSLTSQRSDRTFFLGSHQYLHQPLRVIHYPVDNKQFTLQEPEYFRGYPEHRAIPFDSVIYPQVYFHNPRYMDLAHTAPLNTYRNMKGPVILHENEVLKKLRSNLKPFTEHIKKFIYVGNNNSTAINIVSEKDQIKTNMPQTNMSDNLYHIRPQVKPNAINIVREKDEIITNLPSGNLHNFRPQVKLNAINIVSEKDEIIPNLLNNNIHHTKPQVKTIIPVIVISKHKNSSASLNKTNGNSLLPKTLYQYILEKSRKNKPHPVAKQEDQDDLYEKPDFDSILVNNIAINTTNITKPNNSNKDTANAYEKEYAGKVHLKRSNRTVTDTNADVIKPNNSNLETTDRISKQRKDIQGVNSSNSSILSNIFSNTSEAKTILGNITKDETHIKAFNTSIVNLKIENSKDTLNTSLVNGSDSVTKAEGTNFSDKVSNNTYLPENNNATGEYIPLNAFNKSKEEGLKMNTMANNTPLPNQNIYLSRVVDSVPTVMNSSNAVNIKNDKSQNLTDESARITNNSINNNSVDKHDEINTKISNESSGIDTSTKLPAETLQNDQTTTKNNALELVKDANMSQQNNTNSSSIIVEGNQTINSEDMRKVKSRGDIPNQK